MSDTLYMQTDNDWMCLNCIYANLIGSLEEAMTGHCPVICHAFLIEGGFFQQGGDNG